MRLAARASRNLGLDVSVSFTGALAFPYLYPWPQRPAGLVEEAFAELGRRWKPILNAYEEQGVDIGFEIHPGEDVFDGATFEMFLDAVGGHERCAINYDPSHFLLQQLDYLAFIDIYHERIRAFHVKDAEFNPTGRQGVYSGYQGWLDRAGRFRSLGDGQVDFTGIFSKLAQYGYDRWAVLEWECCLKHPEDGAAEGAPFIRDHIIRVTEKAFDDFAASTTDRKLLRTMMGI
jgi:sugar phosphate isomerase/epimerase